MHDTTHGSGFPDDDLRRLVRLLFRVGRVLEPREYDGLQVSFSEVFALGELADAGTLSQQDLAVQLGLEKSTVSRLTAGLERRGWLSRERDPANRRFYRLRLTAEGQAASDHIGRTFHGMHAVLFGALTPAERAGLRLGLTGLIRAVQEHDRSGAGHAAGRVEQE